MTVLAEILSWSKTRPKWQQDALRRIVQGVELDARQIDELTSMSMQECSATTNADVMPCTPLSEEHIAGLTATSETVVLRAIGNLKNVNALASGHTLQFAESGITVIYGDNGAGKSGYRTPPLTFHLLSHYPINSCRTRPSPAIKCGRPCWSGIVVDSS